MPINKFLGLAIVFAVAFVLGVILFKIFIPFLRKVKLGQKILEIGPSWHKSKEGTPNLGGLFFIIASAVALVVGLFIYKANIPTDSEGPDFSRTLFGVATIFCFALSQGLIGFVDDYVKLFKKRNKGLSAVQKLVLQFLTTAVYLFVNSYFGNGDTLLTTPWGSFDLGIFYYVIMLLVIVYIVNCANLTDGIDGLAGSIAFVITVMFLLFGIKFDTAVAIPCVALCGALLAFLVFNFHPAKIFMGDTGSLFLGGFIVALIMYFNYEFLLLPIGCVWIIEGISVVLQVLSFKLTGKRIFKMAPIHHHFEKCGWGEVKIVALASFVTVLFSVLSYYLLMQR